MRAALVVLAAVATAVVVGVALVGRREEDGLPEGWTPADEATTERMHRIRHAAGMQ